MTKQGFTKSHNHISNKGFVLSRSRSLDGRKKQENSGKSVVSDDRDGLLELIDESAENEQLEMTQGQFVQEEKRGSLRLSCCCYP